MCFCCRIAANWYIHAFLWWPKNTHWGSNPWSYQAILLIWPPWTRFYQGTSPFSWLSVQGLHRTWKPLFFLNWSGCVLYQGDFIYFLTYDGKVQNTATSIQEKKVVSTYNKLVQALWLYTHCCASRWAWRIWHPSGPIDSASGTEHHIWWVGGLHPCWR